MKKLSILALIVAACSFLVGCGIQSSQPISANSAGGGEDGSGGLVSAGDHELSQFEVAVDAPSAADVVNFGVALDPPTAAAGEMATLAVRARVAPTWHIYALKGTKSTGVNVPTSLTLSLPEGLEEVGEWSAPESHLFIEDTYGYEGDVTFRRLVRVKEGASGDQEIACKIGYQTCTDATCKPPAKLDVSATLSVK